MSKHNETARRDAQNNWRRATAPKHPNTKRRARRRLTVTLIHERALAVIDAEADRLGVSRGEAIARLVAWADARRREDSHLAELADGTGGAFGKEAV